MDTLELKHKRIKVRDFQDFIVNGKSLSELFAERDLVGVIVSFKKELNFQAVNQLLLNENSELKSKRIPIYVCSECGNLGCGAITISITQDDNYITWSSFGYENNYQDELLEEYKEVGPFNFSKDDYIKILKQFV